MQSMIEAAVVPHVRVRSAARRALVALLAAVMVTAACSSNSTVTVSDADTDDGAAAAAEPTETPAPTATDAPVDDDNDPSTDDGGAANDGPADEEPEEDDSAVGDDSAGDDDAGADDSSDDGENADGSADDSAGDAIFAGADSGDFCRIAREIDENDPFDDPDLPIFSEEFFDAVLDFYSRVEAIAPDEIRPDFTTIRMGFEQFAALAEAAEYNVLDPRFAEATEAIDTDEFEAAGRRLEAYLLDVCGIDIGGPDDVGGGADPSGDAALPAVPPGITDDMIDALGGVDLENLTPQDIAALSQLLFAQFDLDPALQACLLENLDLLAAAASDPNVLNQPICGTTLLNILSGLG